MTFTHVGPHVDIPVLSDKIVNNRRFYKTPEGNSFPSVTTVLGHEEKQAIVDWRNSLGPAKAKQETERCAARGSAIHEIVEQYLQNKEVDFSKYKNEYKLKFNQIKNTLKKINNINVQEVALYSNEMKIAGRVDCIGEFDGTLAVIDFKTSTNHKSKTMIYDYYLQATAYALMYFEMTGVLIEDIVIIMAVENGFPLLFREKITKYIGPLQKRIDHFYKTVKI